MAPDGSGETRCRICERIGHAHPQCTAVVTLVDAPNPPLHVYFDAGLPPRYHYTDYSRVLTSTALASLPPQNWVIEQRQRQQQQFGQRQRWIDQEQQRKQQQFDQRQRWIDQEQQRQQQLLQQQLLEQGWLDLEQQRLQQQQQQRARFGNEGAVPYRQQTIRAFSPLHREDAFSGSTVNTTTAEVDVEANSAGAQYKQPPPEGGDSGRDDGIARPSQRRQNKSRSDDRATGHDNEVVLGHQKNSEEALAASESRQQLHQRWRRGHHPEKTGSREWEGLPQRDRERARGCAGAGAPAWKAAAAAQARPGSTRDRNRRVLEQA